MSTLFERIIQGEVPSEKVFENERFIVIKDIAPKAPVHLLIIPKKPIRDLQSVKEEDLPLMGEAVAIAQKMAEQLGLTKSGYRFITNNGPDAGQVIFHLHFHLLGGRPLGAMVSAY
jgi:histidine triad (HIT) family protein